ncbi:MAG: hypothetical protein HZA95_02970 [Candidatus Vogelbacteria bacterium]|nr:hypothetical protein [Candidatus Vogelbacteria bacterium]
MLNSEQISRIHRAAKLIEEEGSEGLLSASVIVGEGVATALLISHLRRSLGSMDTYPARPEIEQETNAILDSLRIADFIPPAKVDLTASRAVVFEQSGRVLLLEHDAPGQPEDASELNLSILFDGCELVDAKAGLPPYVELYQFLGLNHLQKAMRDLVLIAFDPSADAELRLEAANEFDEIVGASEMRDKVEKYIVDAVFVPQFLAMVDLANTPRVGLLAKLIDEHVQL